MLIQIAATAAAAAPKGPQYGLIPMLKEGGPVTFGTLAVLVIMFVGTIYILLSKWWDQHKIFQQAQKVRASFWNHGSLKEASGKLEKDSAYKQIIDDGLRAQDQHTLFEDAGDQHDWALVTMSRSRAAIESKLKGGLSFLATVGSTAPFVGLFGTVMGILTALVKIGASGQASIDTVAGPVGEALYMTAIGLAVAVPAVLAYNWLQGRNKSLLEDMGTFANDVHGWMSSNGQVRPTSVRVAAAKAAAAARPATAPAAKV